MRYDDYLDEYNKTDQQVGFAPLDLDVLLENHRIFETSPKNALDHSLSEAGGLKQIIEAQLLSVSSLALYLTKDFNTCSNVIRDDFPASDFQLGSSIIDLANTADCAFKLGLSGFSTQSRILIRSVIERKMQVIVVYFDSEDYEKWSAATETEESKMAYYLVSSKKGRLFKRYSKIERDLLGYKENNKIKEARVNDYEFQSMAVHGGSLAVNIGSWSYIGDSVKPSLFGSPCESVLPICISIAAELHEFNRLLSELLNQVHRWTVEDKHELVNKYQFYRYASEVEFNKYIDEHFERVE